MIRLTRSQPVALLGEAPPRVLVEPKSARANSWEDVADLSARAGIVLDQWQESILRVAMGERSDATWAAKRVGVSVPRQNGKSQLLVARALAGALLFGEKKIVISAHQQDTARETFSKMVEILEADGNEWLSERVRPNGIMNAINREAVKFRNGAVVQFKARTGPGGRGFSSDCLLLDEAQRLKRPAWVSINSTMSAMPNPQVWLLGTPPTREDIEAGMGEVFESIRSSAHAGASTAVAWAEWGATPELLADPAVKAALSANPRVWTEDVEYVSWASNPAWNTRINRDVVEGEFESYTPEEYAQDRLGVWLSDIGAVGTRLITEAEWSAVGVEVAPEGVRSYGVAFSFDGSRVALAGARKHDGTSVFAELIDAAEGSKRSPEMHVQMLADWFAAEGPSGNPRWREAAMIGVSGAAGAEPLRQALLERGVPKKVIHVLSAPEVFAASALAHEGVQSGWVTHSKHEGQHRLDGSVAVCDKKQRGQTGAWSWSATTPDGDETPLEAFSFAVWAARTSKRVPGREQVVL